VGAELLPEPPLLSWTVAGTALSGRQGRLDAEYAEVMRTTIKSTNPSPHLSEARGYLLIALAALFWALSGIVAKFLFSSRPITPLLLVQFRLLSAFVILLVLMAAAAPNELRTRRVDLPFFLIYGSLGMGMVQLTYFTAISEGSVSTAIFLQYLAPLFTALYTVVLLRQRPPAGLAVNLALATAGSGLLLLGGTEGMATSSLGLIAGIGAAVFLSFYTVYGARGVGIYPARTVLLYTLGVGSLFLVPLARPWVAIQLGWGVADWLFLAYMGVFGTLIPFGLFLTGLRRVAPVQATLTAMLEPVLATAGAWLLLGEALTWLQASGGVLIVLAIARLQISRQRQKRQDEPKRLPQYAGSNDH